jgi:hypothetical protein
VLKHSIATHMLEADVASGSFRSSRGDRNYIRKKPGVITLVALADGVFTAVEARSRTRCR